MNRLPISLEPSEFERRTEAWLRANSLLASAVLFGVNLLLKLPRIPAQGLWFEEAETLSRIQGPLELMRGFEPHASAPLYELVLHACTAAFGPSIGTARTLSVVFSALTAPALLYFGRRFLDTRTGVFAALLFTLSRTQLFYGHEAAAYALVGLLCIASFHTFLALLEEPTPRRIVIGAIAAAALVYAHYAAVFALFAQLMTALCLVHVRSRPMRAYLLSGALTAAFLTPAGIHLALRDAPLPTTAWIPTPSPGDVLYVLCDFVGGPILVGLFAAVLAGGFALVRLRAIRLDTDRTIMLGFWFAAPLVLDYACSFAVPSFLSRYLLYASLGLLLLTAYVLTRLPIPEIGRWIALGLILVPSAWSMASDPIVRPDWRRAASIARRTSDAGGLTILTPPHQLLPFSYHFDRSAFSRPDDVAGTLAEQRVHARPTLGGVVDAVQGRADRVVLVAEAGHLPVDIDQQMNRGGFSTVRSKQLTGIDVRIYSTPALQSAAPPAKKYCPTSTVHLKRGASATGGAGGMATSTAESC